MNASGLTPVNLLALLPIVGRRLGCDDIDDLRELLLIFEQQRLLRVEAADRETLFVYLPLDVGSGAPVRIPMH